MQRVLRLSLLSIALLLALAAAALLLAWMKFVPDDAEVARQVAAQAGQRLGTTVRIGSAHLRLWPQPTLVIEDASTSQPQPITIKRLVAQARLMPLLHGRLQLDDVLVDGAVLPQLSLRALHAAPAPAASAPGALQVERLDFRDVVWITRHGLPLEFSGNARFGPDWQLRDAEVLRPGVQPAARLLLTPQGEHRWKVELQVGGGSANGEVALRTGPDGAMALSGRLVPRDIDVAPALAGFKRHSALQGKASGQTTLSASGSSVGELARSLHTRTLFTVASPTLLHIDVDKAIRSFGQDRSGQTALLALAGQMDTQNGADGMVVQYSGLQARGQTFSASGHGTIANRRIEGELTVDLAGGLVGIPLRVSGPLSKPQVNVPARAVAGAAAGAAIGTVVLPGIGTAIGAGVGAAVGKLFGGGPGKPAPAR
ncbi:hypothetical protein ACFPOE_04820 [Caenimonas terrae]|uniref:AsmA family protein n=1 Tax=Caenimonas terrae TaxID=696074 RepID=A0ABW0NAA5_9BURK